MGRLIDADDFSRVIQEYFIDLINHKKYEIDCVECNADIQHFLYSQPQAYDVDKVVEQLEDFRQEMEQFGCDGMLSDMIEVVKCGCSDDKQRTV